MTESKIKANKISVYLIKSEFEQLDDIAISSEIPLEINGVGHFIFDKSYPRLPHWVKDFFGDALDGEHLLTSSAKGILVVPIRKNGKTTRFAVSFGFGRHLLKEGVIEERFGLKVVLNSLDQSSFRSINKTTLGSVPKHSHEQMSRTVSAFEFGIDIEQDLISSVTGRSRDSSLGKIITGGDTLSTSTKVDITNITEFLSHCLERYESNDYKKDFDWIDQIADIKNPLIEKKLNAVLVDKLKKGDLEKIWMAVPEIVDWSDVKGFRCLPKRGNLHDDLSVTVFLEELGIPVTIDLLMQRKIFMVSAATDEVSHHWLAFRCMYAEIALGNEVYILNNGKWYKIAEGFTKQVQNGFEATPKSPVNLPDCSVANEYDYNIAAAGALVGAYCMDRRMITYGGGHSKIEFCDIFTDTKKIFHIKRYAGSDVLSHLFSQGLVSGDLFVGDADFRKKVNDVLPDTHKIANSNLRPNTQDYEIIYGIISNSVKALDIPFFSKVTLRNARRRLNNFGYKVSIKQIKKIGAV